MSLKTTAVNSISYKLIITWKDWWRWKVQTVNGLFTWQQVLSYSTFADIKRPDNSRLPNKTTLFPKQTENSWIAEQTQRAMTQKLNRSLVTKVLTKLWVINQNNGLKHTKMLSQNALMTQLTAGMWFSFFKTRNAFPQFLCHVLLFYTFISVPKIFISFVLFLSPLNLTLPNLYHRRIFTYYSVCVHIAHDLNLYSLLKDFFIVIL